jgi:hypothetical protein
MGNSELKYLRNYATTFRSRGGFGASFVKHNGDNDQWKKGKDIFDVKGWQMIADPHDAMHGFQAFEDKKPLYCIGRIADGWQPPPEDKFGGDWKRVVLLPMYDFETHEPLLFTSQNQGGRDAVANLIDVMFQCYDGHPEDTGKLPICTLSSDSYTNTHQKRIYFPIFEIGGWIERPADVYRIKPLPIDMLALEHKSEPAESVPVPAPVMKEKKKAVAGGGVIGDEIPFAPCR